MRSVSFLIILGLLPTCVHNQQTAWELPSAEEMLADWSDAPPPRETPSHTSKIWQRPDVETIGAPRDDTSPQNNLHKTSPAAWQQTAGPSHAHTSSWPSALSNAHAAANPIVAQNGRRFMPLRWPLPATGITSLFGPRRHPVYNTSRFHYGVDLEAPYGSPVGAIYSGYVVFAGWQGGHGRTVVIEHTLGFESRYSHLSQIIVSTGMRVAMGEAVGLVGNSGLSTGPHLHLELTRWNAHVDPLDYLGSLIPVDE
ncbi:MAG: M23 family metallopeptidase [Myxococcota bacterium]